MTRCPGCGHPVNGHQWTYHSKDDPPRLATSKCKSCPCALPHRDPDGLLTWHPERPPKPPRGYGKGQFA